MKMKKVIVLSVAVAFLATGCGKSFNIFGFTHKSGGSDDSIVLVADAQSAYENGDYAEAERLYLQAITANPRDSKARLGYVQAFIRNSGLDIISLAQNAANQKSVARLTPGFFSQAPSTNGYWLFPKDPTASYGITLARIEGIYQVIIDHFTPVINGETDMPAEDVPPIVYVNRAFAYLLKGAIRIVDKNLDGSVDYLVWHDNVSGEDWVYSSDETTRITASPLTAAEEAAAMADLNAAIADLETARDRSLAKEASVWQEAIDALNSVKNMINELI